MDDDFHNIFLTIIFAVSVVVCKGPECPFSKSAVKQSVVDALAVMFCSLSPKALKSDWKYISYGYTCTFHWCSTPTSYKMLMLMLLLVNGAYLHTETNFTTLTDWSFFLRKFSSNIDTRRIGSWELFGFFLCFRVKLPQSDFKQTLCLSLLACWMVTLFFLLRGWF